MHISSFPGDARQHFLQALADLMKARHQPTRRSRDDNDDDRAVDKEAIVIDNYQNLGTSVTIAPPNIAPTSLPAPPMITMVRISIDLAKPKSPGLR